MRKSCFGSLGKKIFPTLQVSHYRVWKSKSTVYFPRTYKKISLSETMVKILADTFFGFCKLFSYFGSHMVFFVNWIGAILLTKQIGTCFLMVYSFLEIRNIPCKTEKFC